MRAPQPPQSFVLLSLTGYWFLPLLLTLFLHFLWKLCLMLLLGLPWVLRS